MLTKYATFQDAEVLEVKGSPTRRRTASLDSISSFRDYRTDDGYMYVRLRAISSRVNKNNDGWPSVELAGGPEVFERHSKQSSTGFTVEAADGNKEYGFSTFMGKPNFIDHNNSDPSRSRGVVADSKLRVLPIEKVAASGDDYWTGASLDPEHAPPTEIELLIEIDAKQFPIYAKAIRNGEIDGFSMGCDVEESKCSHCGHVATNPDEYCSHILMKGAHHDYKTADGKRISRKSYENCYKIHFFEISAVFDPADETALAREVRAGVEHEGAALEPQKEDGEPWPWDVQHEPEIDEHGNETVHLPPHYPNVLAYLERLDPHGEDPQTQKAIEEHRNYLDSIGYPRPSGDPSDPRMGSVHVAENPLPQSFETTAPEQVDTMRQEHNCPICGELMEGETCDVCGYVEPPKGFDNPDLTKARELQGDMQQGSQAEVQQDNSEAQGGGQPMPGAQPMPPAGGPAPKPGSFLQTRNRGASASVMGDMRWQPKLTPAVAAQIQAKKPVTAAMRNAQDLIEAAKNNHQGDTMSTTHIADGPTGPEASPDARVDATGVGGVIEPSNDAASKADAQVDVEGVGSTGVTDVEAEKTESLPTASEKSDDSGFDATKTTDDSGPTSTFGDSDGTMKGVSDAVTGESLEGIQNKGSSTRQAYDAKPFYDQPGLSGGSAVQGVQPIAEKFGERVDVLQPVATPENNSGPTSQWTGTDGNKVNRQQDPVTKEISDTQFDGFTSHNVAAMKLADLEVKLGLIEEDDKWSRFAALESEADAVIAAQMDMLSRVKVAGTKKLAQQRTAGVTRMPGAFGRMTASTKRFDSVISSEEESQTAPEDTLDSALFSR